MDESITFDSDNIENNNRNCSTTMMLHSTLPEPSHNINSMLSSDNRNNNNNTPSQSIPINPSKNPIQRSSSELRLLEQEQQADLRDYVFFSRLVQGISAREYNKNSNKNNNISNPEEEYDAMDVDDDDDDHHEGHNNHNHGRTHKSNNSYRRKNRYDPQGFSFGNSSSGHKPRRCSPWLQRQNDLCLAHIIGTRNGSGDHHSSFAPFTSASSSGHSTTVGTMDDATLSGALPPRTHTHYSYSDACLTPEQQQSREQEQAPYLNLKNRYDYPYALHSSASPSSHFYPASQQPQSQHEDIFDMDW